MKIRKTIAALFAGSLAFAAAAQAVPVTKGRAMGAGKYALEIGNVNCGWIQHVEGGNAVGDVVSEKLGSDHLHKKHIGNVRYEELSLKAGAGMCNAFYKWVQDSLGGSAANKQATRRSGAIVHTDIEGNVFERMEFTNALVTEIGMPALDAASKDPAYMSLKFSPEITRKKAGSGKVAIPVDRRDQNLWLPSNFRLTVAGLENTTPRVNKIEALTIKQGVTVNAVGEMRDYEQEPGSIETPNLVVTFPESASKAFYDWHEDFVIKGNNGQEKEKTGKLEYLSPDLKTVLFTLTFKNLGVFKVAPDKMESGSEQVRRVKADMYCEDIKFDFKGPSVTR